MNKKVGLLKIGKMYNFYQTDNKIPARDNFCKITKIRDVKCEALDSLGNERIFEYAVWSFTKC